MTSSGLSEKMLAGGRDGIRSPGANIEEENSEGEDGRCGKRRGQHLQELVSCCKYRKLA